MSDKMDPASEGEGEMATEDKIANAEPSVKAVNDSLLLYPYDLEPKEPARGIVPQLNKIRTTLSNQDKVVKAMGAELKRLFKVVEATDANIRDYVNQSETTVRNKHREWENKSTRSLEEIQKRIAQHQTLLAQQDERYRIMDHRVKLMVEGAKKLIAEAT
eukprot:CAMPEP_0167817038 /NCGR_PEP_ID=MMETSP0112_2-20121227/3957_1 /TAXON_ID=91324 /ORGANISM="Lotharella globosa, Strain CCCM811" /LENGTH=159 /DNA_ID=CAMNT_0007716727 /DNA_START=99 /DNA_END=578 /DNA_ORIENTATION=+